MNETMFYDRVFRDYSRPVLVISDSEMNQLKIDQIERSISLLERRLESYTVASEEVINSIKEYKSAVAKLLPETPKDTNESDT